MDIAVLGVGLFAIELIKELSNEDVTILAVDINSDKLDMVKSYASEVMIADIRNINVLKELRLDSFDCVFLNLGKHFETCVLAVAQLRKIGAKTIIASVISELESEILSSIGVNRCVIPDQSSAQRESYALINPYIKDIMEVNKDLFVCALEISQDMAGIPLKDILKFNIRILSKVSSYEPDIEEVDENTDSFVQGDIYILLGAKNAIIGLHKKFKD